mgnify:CR=1 FL=1
MTVMGKVVLKNFIKKYKSRKRGNWQYEVWTYDGMGARSEQNKQISKYNTRRIYIYDYLLGQFLEKLKALQSQNDKKCIAVERQFESVEKIISLWNTNQVRAYR